MLCQLMAQNDTSWFLEDSSPVKSAALISNEIFNGAGMAENDSSWAILPGSGFNPPAAD
jgi:hypothetical protein